MFFTRGKGEVGRRRVATKMKPNCEAPLHGLSEEKQIRVAPTEDAEGAGCGQSRKGKDEIGSGFY